MIHLMMADSNNDLRAQLQAYLARKPEIKVISSVGDGAEASRMLERVMPDVLLLDLALPMVDGFELMQRLRLNEKAADLRIIVLSSMMRDHLIRQAMHMGAAYYMVKPFDPDLLYRRIMQFGGSGQPSEESRNALSIIDRAGVMLRQQGISGISKGYRYLHTGIELAFRIGRDMVGVTKTLYPEIANRFGTYPTSVERAIRSSIESAWNRGAMQRAGLFQGPKRPSNAEFIARMIDEM